MLCCLLLQLFRVGVGKGRRVFRCYAAKIIPVCLRRNVLSEFMDIPLTITVISGDNDAVRRNEPLSEVSPFA